MKPMIRYTGTIAVTAILAFAAASRLVDSPSASAQTAAQPTQPNVAAALADKPRPAEWSQSWYQKPKAG